MVLLALLVVAGVGFEPHDLRVMSPTSYQAAPPRDMFRCLACYYNITIYLFCQIFSAKNFKYICLKLEFYVAL